MSTCRGKHALLLSALLIQTVYVHGQDCTQAESARDQSADPRVISGQPGTHVVLMDATTATPDLGMLCGQNPGHTVWFAVTPEIDGPLSLSTCHPSTSYDTTVQAWVESSDPDRPTLLFGACADDTDIPECANGCGGTAAGSVVSLDAAAGTTYLFQVGSFNANAVGCSLCLGVIVTVGDTCTDSSPPAIFCPQDLVVDATNGDGAVVDYEVTAQDFFDPAPLVTCDPPPGSFFPVGVHLVFCTATDSCGNASACTFTVSIRDLTPPTIQCPADTAVSCTSPLGTVVEFTPTASDLDDPNPVVTCDPPSGSTFAPGKTVVTCTATDLSGNQSTCSFEVDVVDSAPPSISCPADQVVECSDPTGALVDFEVLASDACDPDPSVVSNPPPGTIFPPGDHIILSTATDAAGNSASCSFQLTVADTTPPSIQCPSDSVVACSETDGIVVEYAPTATDLCDPNPAIVCNPPSGSRLAVGAHQILCTATDSSGNSASCTFTVTVGDTTPPTITCPPLQSFECEGASGVVVDFTVTATDTCDPSPRISCSPPSGSTFGPGLHAVICTATDVAGNIAICIFTVTVRDTTNPSISCPQPIRTESTSPAGATVDFAISAFDSCDPNPNVFSRPPAGSVFPPGTTSVDVTAEDSSGNRATCSFDVTVEDTIPPQVNCPADSTVFIAPGEPDPVFEFAATAVDLGDPDPTVVSDPPSGAVFPVGLTTVVCTATDAAGNTSTCSFTVSVQMVDCVPGVLDETPPEISCPQPITVECEGVEGSVVDFQVSAIDSCDPNPTVVSDPPAGARFAAGLHQIFATAIDAAGNTSSCTFTVTVRDTTPPVLNCPPAMTVECDDPTGVAVDFSASTADLCDANPTVLYDPPPGSRFAFGTHVVSATAVDAAGNTSTCEFTVRVVDTTSPTVVCPADTTAECTSPEGAVVEFTLMATDGCETAASAAASWPSGSVFPIGTTTVDVTATDASENDASCSFEVTVRDTTPPVISCRETMQVQCDVRGGVAVEYDDVSAADLCDPAPAVECDPPSGSVFPVGSHTVTCTATDEAGNSSSCTFSIEVAETGVDVEIVGPGLAEATESVALRGNVGGTVGGAVEPESILYLWEMIEGNGVIVGPADGEEIEIRSDDVGLSTVRLTVDTGGCDVVLREHAILFGARMTTGACPVEDDPAADPHAYGDADVVVLTVAGDGDISPWDWESIVIAAISPDPELVAAGADPLETIESIDLVVDWGPTCGAVDYGVDGDLLIAGGLQPKAIGETFSIPVPEGIPVARPLLVAVHLRNVEEIEAGVGDEDGGASDETAMSQPSSESIAWGALASFLLLGFLGIVCRSPRLRQIAATLALAALPFTGCSDSSSHGGPPAAATPAAEPTLGLRYELREVTMTDGVTRVVAPTDLKGALIRLPE